MAKRTSTTDLSSLTMAQIQAELRRRLGKVAVIQRRRARLASKIAALDAQISEAGGDVNGAAPRAQASRRGRRRNGGATLAESLHKVLQGKTMGVTEAGEAAKAGGYKSKSKAFRLQTNIALIKRKDLFKRVGRGLYTAR